LTPVSASASAFAAINRIGVFGGAFDPPHAAHHALAQAALKSLALDQLRIVPTGQAWHKTRALTSPAHRLAMAQLAFADLPGVWVDPIEMERQGPSYTVDTLRALKQQFPQAELFLVMGADQARALTTWHEWQEVLRLAIICVAEREDLAGSSPPFVAPKAYESRFRRLLLPVMPVSATDIRDKIAKHGDIAPLVFESVARYIDHHHLYQTP
jgi:nicotinate-nucleotide adenylyltransferase